MTRCAIYVRYSSDLQSASSLADQERECREFAFRNGWDVVQVYEDAALSGGSDKRPGYQSMLHDAKAGHFDVLLAEALDRLSRRLADTATLFDELNFYDVQLHTKSDGEITKMHTAIMGMMSEQFISDLREKTRRGQRGRVLAGKTAGGLGYGYTVKEAGEREIEKEEAAVVVRIFSEYASGVSPQKIAQRLNSEKIPGPRGSNWKATTIRGQKSRGTGILNNEAYIGQIVYGRTEYKKDPRTGKKVARLNNESEWVRSDAPELRIVSDELWNSVKLQQKAVTLEMPRDERGNPLNRAHRKQHPLSGLVTCGVCGGNMAIAASERYGCSTYRNSRACTNSKTIRRTEVEDRVFAGLRDKLFDSHLVGEFLKHFQAEVHRLRKDQSRAEAKHRKRILEIPKQIDRLVEAIAEGNGSAAIKRKIKDLEDEQETVRLALDASSGSSNIIPFPNIEAIYRTRVEKLIDGLSDDAIRQEAISIIQTMVDSVTVTPTTSGFDLDLKGDLAALLALVDAEGEPFSSGFPNNSLSVVAGAGFEPATFRL